MLTTFQEKKLGVLFRAFDADANGFIERGDYTDLARNIAGIRRVALGTPDYAKLEELILQSWEELRTFADTDGDGRIGPSEWNAFHDQFLSSADAFEMFYQRTAGFIFALIDRDGDGKVDLTDHRDFLRAVRVQLGPWADANFRAADTDGDGLLDYDEVAAVLRDFYYSNDPTIPASSWLGPVA
ncbi:MAG: EF-hand domain-containing protein [Polyangiales bacterium]